MSGSGGSSNIGSNTNINNYGVGGSRNFSSNRDSAHPLNSAQVGQHRGIGQQRRNANQRNHDRPINRGESLRNAQVTESRPLSQAQSTGNFHAVSTATAGPSTGNTISGENSVELTRETIPRNSAEALMKIQKFGFVEIMGDISASYTTGINLALSEKADLSHIIAVTSLHRAAKKAFITLQDTQQIEDIRKLAELCETYACVTTKYCLTRLENAKSLAKIRTVLGQHFITRSRAMIGFHTLPRTGVAHRQDRQVDILETEALAKRAKQLAADAGIAENRQSCSKGTLDLYKKALYLFIADYSIFVLFRHLRSNLANIFAQAETDLSDELMGIGIKACITVDKANDPIRSIDDTDAPLEVVMDEYRKQLDKQQGSVLKQMGPAHVRKRLQEDETLIAAELLQAEKTLAEAAELQGERIETALKTHSDLESRKNALKDIVLSYSDSFRFDYAKGPHHAVNRDLTEKMGRVYHILTAYAEGPRGNSVNPFFTAIESLYAELYGLLRNFGVPENDLRKFLFQRGDAETGLIRHILLGDALPERYLPYKCTEIVPFDGPFKVDGGPTLYAISNQGALHKDYVGHYLSLMETIDAELMFGHTNAAQTDGDWSHTLTFDYPLDDRRTRLMFCYEVNDNTITDAELYALSMVKIKDEENPDRYYEKAYNGTIVWKMLPPGWVDPR